VSIEGCMVTQIESVITTLYQQDHMQLTIPQYFAHWGTMSNMWWTGPRKSNIYQKNKPLIHAKTKKSMEFKYQMVITRKVQVHTWNTLQKG